MENDNTLICGAFHARAEPRSSLIDIRNAMKGMPEAKHTSTGTRMLYSIGVAGDRNAPEAMLELAPKGITFTFYFKEPNHRVYKHNLLRFLSILAYLKDEYSVDISEIYGYVIEALRYEDYTLTQEAASIVYQPNERMDVLNRVNVSLSHELSLKNERIRTMDKQLAAYFSFSKKLIQKLSVSCSSASPNTNEILKIAGIDEGLAKDILLLIDGNIGGDKKDGDKHD